MRIQAQGPGDGPRPALRGRRVLAVEDGALVTMLVEEELRAAGAEVLAASTPADAPRLVAATAEDGGRDPAILDVNLGGEEVFPVADELRSRGVRFVFSTGYDEWALPDAYKDVPRCEKPIDMPCLARALFG